MYSLNETIYDLQAHHDILFEKNRKHSMTLTHN